MIKYLCLNMNQTLSNHNQTILKRYRHDAESCLPLDHPHPDKHSLH